MTRADDSEMRDLLELAARLGRDPLVIQGPGGNISLKRDGVMWVKASGTWMMEAMARSILIPVDFAAVLDGLAAGDPACETCSAFVRRDLSDLPLRPSIETTLHAVMPQRVVVHVHCVETISIACLSDAAERLAATLSGLNWSLRALYSPGRIAGADHGRTSRVPGPTSWCSESMDWWLPATACPRRNGCARRCRDGSLASPARRRWRIARRWKPLEGDGYSIAEDDRWHAIATDPISLAAARRGSLYPDHVVFLGPGIVATEAGETAADAARRSGRAAAPLVVVPGAGVLLHDAATAGARALIRCLADVTCRLDERRSDRRR